MVENPSPISVGSPDLDRIKLDQAMVERINGGCVETWQEFVTQYSSLIYFSLRRQLMAEDEEEIHTVFVDTLKQLYETNLKRYSGRSLLSTWVVLVTRTIAIDYLRQKRGRRRYPKGYNKLSGFDRKVFELYYIEGLGFDGLIHTLRWQGESCTVTDIARAILEVEKTVDDQYLKRLEFDRGARKAGAASGAELRYILDARAHHENSSVSEQPERILLEKEADELKKQIAVLWDRLPAREKALIDLKFKFGWRAAKIAEHLGLDGQRQVYRLTNAIVKKMRHLIYNGSGDSGIPSTEKSGPPKV